MSEPSYRRIVRANRLASEGKCPGCEMDYKPKIKALLTKIAELEATIESQNHYLEFIHEECRKTARACGAEVSDATQAGDANVAARQALKKGRP